MRWNPLRRRRDTEPVTVDVTFDDECADCGKRFRESPGHWHVESQSEGVCNTCFYRIQERLRRPYGRTRIGF